MPSPEGAHYRAFISYSHVDSGQAIRLHRALEAFRMPSQLVGVVTDLGPVPRRLTPIFRDRDELPASGDLSAQLRGALAEARFLIVIASPASARSRWVNEEVRAFKAMHGEARVLVAIVAGEPNVTAQPGRADEECFCPALRFQVDATGAITTVPAEPVAADLRPAGDGRRRARLKLIAGLTGLPLDGLVRREAQVRHRRMTWLAIAASALALVMAGLTLAAIRARHEAERQRAAADGLVEFMLTDLRKKLEPVGRLDVLDVVGQRALHYYADQDLATLDADALGRRARALHLVGEVRNTRGDSQGALAAFHQALATTGELLARDPHNGQRVFDQAQSVYWVGYVAWQRGQNAEAEAMFRAYKRYADDLVRIDPHNSAWQMEVSYADSNLGTLLFEQGRYAEAESHFATALALVEAAAAHKRDDADAQSDLGEAISWLAKTEDALNHTDRALALLAREQAIYRHVLAHDPANMTVRRNLVVALQMTGREGIDRGDTPAAIAGYRAAEAISAQLLAKDPNNTKWREIDVITRSGLASALLDSGDLAAMRTELAGADQSLDRLARSDPRNLTWTVDFRARLAMLAGSRLAASRDCRAALPVLKAAAASLARAASGGNRDLAINRALAQWRAGDCAQALGDHAEAVADWRAAQLRGPGADADARSQELLIRYATMLRLGNAAQARQIAAILDRRGYRAHAYLREKATAARH